MSKFSKGLTVTSLILAATLAAGCSSTSPTPTPAPSSAESPVTPSLPPVTPNLTAGWLQVREISPRLNSSTHLVQESENTWALSVVRQSGTRVESVQASLEDGPTNDYNGLSAPTSNSPLGIGLSLMVLDYNPERLSSNVSTYLFPDQLAEMRASHETQRSFKLTPEMVTIALKAQITAGLNGLSDDAPIVTLAQIFEDDWPEVEIMLTQSGELKQLTMTNGSYTSDTIWATA